MMKSFFAVIVFTVVLALCSCSTVKSTKTVEIVPDLSLEGFKITSVMSNPKQLNALGKMEMITDSNEVGRSTELSKNLPRAERGEEFRVDWRYSGKMKLPQAVLKFEYIYGKNPAIHTYEKTYTGIMNKTYTVILRNVGKDHRKNGEIAHWRITITAGETVVASKQSRMWASFENYSTTARKKE